jgi:hypothetical protein
MKKDIMIFKDGSEISLEAGASLGNIQVISESKYDMISCWEKFTNENLSEVQIKNGDYLTVGTYKNLVLVSETSTVRPDKTILTSYSLREKTAEEVRLDALEDGQDVLNGAIADLGEITSSLAGEMEGGLV